MSVGRICVRTVWTAEPGERVQAAAARMAERGVGTVVVLDEGRIPIGILSDRDIMIRCVVEGMNADRTLVSELMSSPVSAVREDTPIEDALSHMAATGVRRTPVVDDKDRLVGIVALDDFLELFAREATSVGRLIKKRS
ncbi:MAG: CBS domain-containing protein [Deltaproteobacteria bacterium]|nr:CBS domain-containing protein [Deltaproteobacteria bacterium]